jgi:hypothetical protein
VGVAEGKNDKREGQLAMSVTQFITTEKLVEYLDQEANSLLTANGIYDIGSYGWQSEDTEDPEYIGHAMWQLEPPVETEWGYIFDGGAVQHRPTDIQKRLMVAGSDFEGLMRASRLSAGLCLLHKTIAERRPLDDNHYFWLHHTDTVLQLNIASDRIREYFVLAFFGETSESYKNNEKKNAWYVTPFIQARDRSQSIAGLDNLKDAISPLPAMAEVIYEFRESRNEIVHKISTKLGRREKELIESQQEAYDAPRTKQATGTIFNYEQMLKDQTDLDAKHKNELSESINRLVSWYKVLIKFSSYVFEAEHWLRKRSA